jgi:hypothetical protein
MIQFPCTGCGQVFSVADDEAGRSIQCPQCARLTDVPLHSELGSLAEDGTFKLNEPATPAADPSERIADIALAFQKRRVDDDGEEIDLRNTPDELVGIGEPTALEMAQRKRHKPQYDPETGELVRPLDVQPDDRDIDPASIPMATPAPVQQSAPISYAAVGDVELYRHTPFQKLMEPVNLAVMGFVLLGLVIGYTLQLLFISIIEQTFPMPVWPLNIMFWLAACHFGNTIVAIGPEEHDELPRPLLSLSFWDDIFGPMFKVLGAVLLCYLPMFAVLTIIGGPARILALPLMVVGGYYFPAVLLTATTSGNIMNLHPARIRNVIRLGGKRYVRLAIGWIIVFPLYVWATLRVNLIFSSLGIETGPYSRRELLLAGPLAVLSVVFLHYFCWELGLLFRAGHERFGWVWEELLRQREEDRKKRGGGLSAADRAIMRRERQRRAEAAGQPTAPRQAGPGLGPR